MHPQLDMWTTEEEEDVEDGVSAVASDTERMPDTMVLETEPAAHPNSPEAAGDAMAKANTRRDMIPKGPTRELTRGLIRYQTPNRNSATSLR